MYLYMCQSMDPALQKIFLDNVPDKTISAEMLRRLKRGLKMGHTDKIRGNAITRKCAMCDFESLSNDEFKTHMKNMHRGMKPHQCTTCGKCFGSKARLESHESTGHLKVKGK